MYQSVRLSKIQRREINFMEKVKRILVSTLILIMALSFGMVGSQTDASAKKAKKVTISLNKKKHTLQIGKTLKLKAKVKPAKKKKNVTFKSSNKRIASVTKKGVVKGKKKGKATITAKIKGTKKKATCKITVIKKKTPTPKPTPRPPVVTTVPVSAVTLDKTSLDMYAGTTETLTATVTPANATNKVITWRTSDDKVATVKNGTITALAKGTATITATNPGSGKSASCTINVKDEIVITNQAELNNALNNDKLVSITIQTNGAENFVIPAGTRNGTSLTFNAPNATLTNGSDFDSVTILGGNYEQTTGWNNCTVLANTSIKIGQDASANITVAEPVTAVSLINDGVVPSVNVYSAAKIKISGTGEDLISLNVSKEANVVTNQPVKASATAKIVLSLLGGAEDSTVSVDTAANKPEIRGVGYIEVSYKDGTPTETVVPGALDPEDAVKVNVTGNVKDAYDTDTNIADTQIYLIADSVDLDLEEAAGSVGEAREADPLSARTDSDGNYYFSTVPIGNYCLIAKKDGFKTAIQRFTVSDSSGETFSNEVLYLLNSSRADSGSAVINGTVKNATNVKPVAGLTVNLYRHKGNTIGTPVATTTSDAEGLFQFTGLQADQYTIQVAGGEDYISSRKNACVTADSTQDLDMLVSPKLSGNGVRFVLTWGNYESGAPEDLDAHLVGPTTDGSKFEVYYSSKIYGENDKVFAQLDVDDMEYEGPETITLENTIDGIYTFYVDNYSKSPTFATSQAQVNVYKGSELVSTYNAPSGTAKDIWKVCTYNSVSGRVRGINKYISESEYDEENGYLQHGFTSSIQNMASPSLNDYDISYSTQDGSTHLRLELYTDVTLTELKESLRITFADNKLYTYNIVEKGSQEWNEKYADADLSEYCNGILEIHKSDTEITCYELFVYIDW